MGQNENAGKSNPAAPANSARSERVLEIRVPGATPQRKYLGRCPRHPSKLALPDFYAVLDLIARMHHEQVAFRKPLEDLRLEPVLTTDFHLVLVRHSIRNKEHGRI